MSTILKLKDKKKRDMFYKNCKTIFNSWGLSFEWKELESQTLVVTKAGGKSSGGYEFIWKTSWQSLTGDISQILSLAF